MTQLKTPPSRTVTSHEVEQYLRALKLAFIAEHYGELAQQAAHKQWSHLDYLGHLVEGEALLRQDRATTNRIRLARFPVLKTLDQFRWDWPTQINRALIQHHFTLSFLKDHMNVIYLGGVGLGKTHLAIALGYEACRKGHAVLFAGAIDVINTLVAAKSAGRLKQEIKKYAKPTLLILDEIGYLPIDKSGADLLFQVISVRYEHGSTLVTSNRAFKDWPKIFNNDSTLTAALLDRLLHHADTVVIEGKSYRMTHIPHPLGWRSTYFASGMFRTDSQPQP
jgi:DNA replication protein DnaC